MRNQFSKFQPVPTRNGEELAIANPLGLTIIKRTVEEATSKRYANVPPHALPKAKINGTTANGITKAILQYLRAKGHYCSRIQSQGQWQPHLKRFTSSTVRRGIGDIMAIVNGRTVMIEVKAGKDRQSNWQKQTEADVKDSGGVYMLVRTLDEFIEQYNAIK